MLEHLPRMRKKALSSYSYQDYLDLEKDPEIRYEFHDGFIVAMAGGTPQHGLICMNFSIALGNSIQAKGLQCGIYSSDVKVRIERTNRTFYPDASVVCEPPVTSEKDKNAITNPNLILEVLSDSTALFDMGEKFAHYRQIESLREYVLVSQTESLVIANYRTPDGTWDISTYFSMEDVVVLQSMGVELRMTDIYRLAEGIEEPGSSDN